jgi:ribosome-binding factor A
MAGRRLPRLNEQMKRDIAEVLRTQVRDPRVAGVTVTSVQVTPDLTLARVRVQVSADPEERSAAFAGLEASGPFIRRAVGQGMRIRRMPELRFLEDESLDHAARIEAILREVVPPGGWPEEVPADEEEAEDGTLPSPDPEA